MEVEENLMRIPSAFLFLVVKNNFKSSLNQCFHPFINEFFRLSFLQFRIDEKINTKVVVDVSRGTKGRVFLFSWEGLEGG